MPLANRRAQQRGRITPSILAVAALAMSSAWAQTAPPRVDRVVILKVDGLPPRLIDQYVKQPAEGKAHAGLSRLPWIDSVFVRNGVWFDNFYTRGLSLSAPSWSLLDTGRHLEIRGNVEYDRYTLRPYDYLNFFPFYLAYAKSARVDMRGVEVLDEAGIPLLLDRFPFEQRYEGFQLLQRGARWMTLESTLKRAFSGGPKDVFDEWMTGISMSESFNKQNEVELLAALKNPQIRYLDYFTGEYDHTAHLTADPVSQFRAIEDVDALVGRVWDGISKSSLADTTALILISDHGMNTSPEIFSQGFNLVDWFNSRAGGAHNVLTNRHPLTEFKLKGLDPFVTTVITPSSQSAYLAGQSESYPTVMLDLDGNERASVGLRNNTLNVLHILLDQLINRRLRGSLRSAVLTGLFKVLNQVRVPWQRDLTDLKSQLAELDGTIASLQTKVAAQPKKKQWTQAERDRGLDKEARREVRQLETSRGEHDLYARYIAIITRLLGLTPADFDPGKFKLTDLIPARSLGPLNSLHDLQHYVIGPGPQGFVLTADGQLDLEHSFSTIDYPAALASLSVRNNVQSDVASQPIDYTAIRISRSALTGLGAMDSRDGQDAVWLYRDPEHQALVLTRSSWEGQQLRYVPVSHLLAHADGTITFDAPTAGPGFPLALLEDGQFNTDGEPKANWLSQWHSEKEWMRAVYRTRYSNGIISVTEQLLTIDTPHSGTESYQHRKRDLRRTDMLVMANDHWNFNVRGFNPGGNHGSFLRTSTQSVLLVAGGKNTGLPAGVRVATPYDSLSFVPTVLTMMDRPEPDLPGPVIKELLPTH